MATNDKQGRKYAKLSELRPNDEVELDPGFPCKAAGKATVHFSGREPYFLCSEGLHFLSGQVDSDGHCVGVYKI